MHALLLAAILAAPTRLPTPFEGAAGTYATGGGALSDEARSAVSAQIVALHTVPFWNGSFTSQGRTWRYSMVGRDPRGGGATRVETVLIALSYRFEDFADPATGEELVMDLSSRLPLILASPNFNDATYATGTTQFGDAVQRAEFWNVAGPQWHTLLNPPRVVSATIDVPAGAGSVQQAPNGANIAFIDGDFLYAAITSAMQTAHVRSDELPIVVTPTTCAEIFGAGCALGFHDRTFGALLGHDGRTFFLQTLVWASWLEPGAFPDQQDVTAISHEISEWMNDPFLGNWVPEWGFPDFPALCQDNLETGDPLELLDEQTSPVTIGGFTYHPQTEALWQWFAREVPSSAYGGAYSFPDSRALTSPASDCGPSGPPGPPPPDPPPPPP